ncbi:hypothetical protein RAB80_016453 [Fusarium oxysporum f. sp. vasinfectum]|uniref:Uncharacterized protein n=1 Tax=Fusarium oxysporum f. sp. vasinfectum 25433 TaxID=1089449 RepID=X0KZY8_FUSOX|nr:hypothetical protein FOTG_17267 [Fusarium oxysporum f. sp. vasinfectum 25433]KAK2667262.1 hypothetical protein RAB80_016453 [Fusarium oxysporum f. sp. vasinfectum]KAK2931872.1 hypothetical protein FoTM2_009390 [Fusarium oxysporum f. sp. vasinfectum]
MSLNIIVPHVFLPQSSVKLARFIRNVDHPHQSYHDPLYAETPKSTVSTRETFVGLNHKSSNTSFASALTSLMSAGFSKRAKAQVKITADCVKTYALDNSDDWFTKATDILATKTWIERQADRGHNIYMVVGFHTITNARIVQELVHGIGAGGQIHVPFNLSLAAFGAVVPLGEIIDPSVGGNTDGVDSAQTSFMALGEQICALQYRKIRHRWLSSKSTDTFRLSKSPRWSSVERSRDEEDGEDDIIKVEAAPLSENGLDGKWDKMDALGGEVLLIRAGEITG